MDNLIAEGKIKPFIIVMTYGNNRANFSFIAGGVVAGILMPKPDFPENKEEWPFFWGENEVVIGICAQYIFLGAAVSSMEANWIKKKKIIKGGRKFQ
jgi:hypothetical protein